MAFSLGAPEGDDGSEESPAEDAVPTVPPPTFAAPVVPGDGVEDMARSAADPDKGVEVKVEETAYTSVSSDNFLK